MALSAFAIFAAPATATPEKLRDSPRHLRQNIFLVLGRADSGRGLGNFHHRTKWHPVTRPALALAFARSLRRTAVDLYTRGGKPALEKYLDSIDRSARAPRRKTPAVFRTRARL